MPWTFLVANYGTARARAQALEAKHLGGGSPQPWNPHSSVWRLVDVIKTGRTAS